MRWNERRTAVRSHFRRLSRRHAVRCASSSAVAHLVLVRWFLS
jgi:hypothetical protein